MAMIGRAARLILICHAETRAIRAGAFPTDDEALNAGGRRAAAALRERLPTVSRVLAGPARAARETADALGLSPRIEPALRDADFGRWAGLSLSAVAAREPEALGRWRVEPDQAPHGGEPVTALCGRIGDWLDTGQIAGRTLAVTHAAVVRAAVVHVLGARLDAFWRIDAGPLTMVEFTRHGRVWNLHVGQLFLRGFFDDPAMCDLRAQGAGRPKREALTEDSKR